jgi:purine-binding chemotaxis protein CheW
MASVATLSDTTIVGVNEEQLVTMIVDNQLFGIPILQVQDIVEASKITPVPLAPSAIAGVLNLRGRIVTVIDLRKLLGNDEEVPWDSQMGVTVEYKGDLYTLLVDAIGDVRTLPKRDFDSAPSTMEDKVRQICSGIFRLRGNLLVVLDVSRILLPEAIEATPMLTVEDRRARKDAAQAASEGTKAEKGRQLSALMTDLNAYESDYDSGLEYQSGEDDDIKARKKANRNRRPVNERWQEVLEEKARREGTVSFRMREPDEEILEDAREEAQEEENSWESEWRARQSGEYESRFVEPEAPAEDLSGRGQPATEEPTGLDAPSGSDAAPSEAESPTGVGDVVSDWWGKMRGAPKSDDNADQPEIEESPVELPPSDEPAPERPVTEEPAADSAPAMEDKGAANAGKASDDAGKKAKKGTSSRAKGKTTGRAKKKK